MAIKDYKAEGENLRRYSCCLEENEEKIEDQENEIQDQDHQNQKGESKNPVEEQDENKENDNSRRLGPR